MNSELFSPKSRDRASIGDTLSAVGDDPFLEEQFPSRKMFCLFIYF